MRSAMIRVFVDDFNRDAIHRIIHHLYEEKKHLTLCHSSSSRGR